MFNVNLIRKRNYQKDFFYHLVVIFISMILAISTIVFAIKTQSTKTKILKIESQNLRLTKKLAELSKIYHVKESIKNQLILIENYQHQYKILTNDQQKLLQTLAKLSEVIPNDLYLDTISINENFLTAKGNLQNTTQANDLNLAIERKKFLQNQTIEILENSPENHQYAFVLKGSIKVN